MTIFQLQEDHKYYNVSEEKPEEAEYWLEHTTQIVTKQLACLDEHKLECVVVLLAGEALSWLETTTLTASAEKASKPIEQYVAEFCKYCKYGAKYIKMEKDKCRKFTDGLNDKPGPMFTAMEIEDF
ncbi:hypothetical protein V6N12_050621 [Hibiscus sabdariffa]|uniref:Retrotransposon gag domain-containing protein n=1 Tax=Hibiscus sabdariffa TaxID=183260 RepID=A0ABR2GCY1_9ROSI